MERSKGETKKKKEILKSMFTNCFRAIFLVIFFVCYCGTSFFSFFHIQKKKFAWKKIFSCYETESFMLENHPLDLVLFFFWSLSKFNGIFFFLRWKLRQQCTWPVNCYAFTHLYGNTYNNLCMYQQPVQVWWCWWYLAFYCRENSF